VTADQTPGGQRSFAGRFLTSGLGMFEVMSVYLGDRLGP